MKRYLCILFLFFFSINLSAQADSTIINKKVLASAIITESVLYAGTISGLRYVWYKDVERVPFHFYNDNKGYLQIDKFGHAYGSFLESKICYEWLRKAGVKKNKALLYGGTMGIILQTPIEVFDGLYKGWGFSWGDMIANSAGSFFLIAQELIFDDQMVDMKFSFTRSSYADASNGMLGENALESLFYDYNGHTYWFSFSPSKYIPEWINVSLGYSANGMYGEFENYEKWGGVLLPEVDRYRQYLFSLDVDWTKIPTDRDFLKKLFFALNHIKLPFPAIEYNSLKQWKFHSFYF